MTKSNKKTHQHSKGKPVYQKNAQLSNQVNKEVLETDVQFLVNMKLESSKKQHCLNHNHYKEVHLKIKAIGMQWLTPYALKSCVIHAYNVARFECPQSDTGTD